jgi:hypothetical protein
LINSKKIFFLVIFLFCKSYFFCQDNRHEETSNDSILVWNRNIKLSWEDFKYSIKNIKKKEDLSAGVFSGISFSYIIKGGRIKYKIVSEFSRYESYVIFKSEDLLKHEQLHFDIVEVYSRKLRKKFIILDEKESKLEDYIFTYNIVRNNLAKYQDLYDSETLHSKNKQKQKEWEEKVSNELEELKEFDVSTDIKN